MGAHTHTSLHRRALAHLHPSSGASCGNGIEWRRDDTSLIGQCTGGGDAGGVGGGSESGGGCDLSGDVGGVEGGGGACGLSTCNREPISFRVTTTTATTERPRMVTATNDGDDGDVMT